MIAGYTCLKVSIKAEAAIAGSIHLPEHRPKHLYDYTRERSNPICVQHPAKDSTRRLKLDVAELATPALMRWKAIRSTE